MQFRYQIQGMHCESCVEKIKSALSPHYNMVSVTFKPPLLIIEADKSPMLNELNNAVAAAGKYRFQEMSSEETVRLADYYPIFLIAAYITGVATINNLHWPTMQWQMWMNQFMAGFFLVFSAFKLMDLPGFAEGYATYDLLAKRWFAYGYFYPFMELSLGILYLTQWFPTATYLATILIMGFSSLGVINSLLKKQRFQCACLGTLLKVPLSTVTLIEDLTMVIMALCGLLLM